MNFNEAHIELFDRYNNNDLQPEELIAFKNRLKTDANFASEFDAFNSFEREIKASEVAAFKNKLSAWDKVALPAKKSSRIISLRTISILAAVLVLGFITVYSFVGESNQELATNHFEPYENIVTIRGEKVSLDEGLQHYEKEEYKSAIEIFKALPSDHFSNFYLAESEFALGNFEAAIFAYQESLKEGSTFKEVADFHLGLAYLANNQEEKATNCLSAIDASSFYYEDAQAVLSDLK